MFKGAQWIWPDSVGCDNAYAQFSDGFIYDGNGLVTASVSVSGEFVLFINGVVAGFGQYADWPDKKTYNECDITRFCSVGENEFSLSVWHPGINCQIGLVCPERVIFSVYSNDQALLLSGLDMPCRALPGYRNGRVPLITSQLGYSFEFDANDKGAQYGRARVTAAPKDLVKRPTRRLVAEPLISGELVAQGVYFDDPYSDSPAQKMRRAALSARFIEEMDSGNGWICADSGDGIYLVYDMGCETSGYFSLRAEFREACDVLIGFGEHLKDLRVRTDIDSRGFCGVYRAKPGKNLFTYSFRRWGCRYLQIHIAAKAVCVNIAGIIPISYRFDRIPDFSCDDHLHNEIYNTCIKTLKLCAHEHYEDCPWREQALYSMDARNQMLCGYYAFAQTELPRESLRLLAGGLRDDGLLELCAPAKIPITIPSFSLMFIVAVWEYFLYTADGELANEMLPTVLKILDAAAQHLDDEGRMMRFVQPQYWNFYEWRDRLDGEGPDMPETDRSPRPEGILTAYYALALDAAANICENLSKDDETAKLRKRLDDARLAMESFWDEDRRIYANLIEDNRKSVFAELTQALALISGACPQDRKDALIKRLYNSEGLIPVTLNDYMLKYQALLLDEEKYADIVFNDIASVWGNMLFKGATSFWETDKGADDFHGAGSLCHGWSACPAYFYYAYGLGIRPDKPGHFINNDVKAKSLGRTWGRALTRAGLISTEGGKPQSDTRNI